MKKIAILILSICLLVAFASTPAMAAGKGTGFDPSGVNVQARVFNGWVGDWNDLVDGGDGGGTGDMWITVKWSKDWIWPDFQPSPGDTPPGAWLIANQIGYTNDSGDPQYATLVTWTDKNSIPDATYKVLLVVKIMRVSDNSEAWDNYQLAGGFAFSQGGAYGDGVPNYVIFQYTAYVYEDGTLVGTYPYISIPPSGLGHLIF